MASLPALDPVDIDAIIGSDTSVLGSHPKLGESMTGFSGSGKNVEGSPTSTGRQRKSTCRR
jgi:hypothetical protein